MANIEENLLTRIENTSNYGLIKENVTTFDEQRILGEYLLNFKIHKIVCWSEINVGLSGIKIIHINRITSEKVESINVNKKEFGNEEEEEIILEKNEMINNIILWKEEALRGFEIKTNKKTEQKFGWCGEGTRIELDEFDGYNYLVGFFLGFHKKEGILSMGFYYINKKNFYLLLNLGIFMLRVKLKNKEFNKKIKDNLNNLDIVDKAVYFTCCLPDNQFFEIFKYIFV